MGAPNGMRICSVAVTCTVLALSSTRPFAHAGDVETYQIGSQWSRIGVTSDYLKQKGEAYWRLARGTALYSDATAFYLGKYDGEHLLATAHHVQRGRTCNVDSENHPFRAWFPFLEKNYPCVSVIGSWESVDLAIFSIAVPEEDEAALEEVAHPFAWHAPIHFGQEVLSMGFGVAGNPERRLTASDDSDCRVWSGENEFRFLYDPDTTNSARYSAWSFAIGCDLSPGDSGSAVVDRTTGRVLGLVWTGAVPRPEHIRDSDYLRSGLGKQAIWSELNYAIPSQKIREVLWKETEHKTSLSNRFLKFLF